MAVNKRKVLDSARKYAQKGAKQKALKEYNTLLKLDPRDAKLHLEIGDAHRRWGQIDEAIAQYLRVADQYKADGFDARAVAVFKQVLNLDPKRYSAHVALSELYQRIGLDSEASASLQTAADGYYREGMKREALDLLRKMAALDPSNTTNRMKVAELLRQEGMNDDAVAEYEEVATELQRQGARDVVCSVYERILEIQPRRVDVLISVARILVDQQRADRAETFAKRAVELAPDETDHYDLLCDIYSSLERPQELEATTRSLAKVYRDRGDDQRARELIQRLPSGGALEAEGGGQADLDLTTPLEGDASGDTAGDDLLIDDDLLDDGEFLDFDAEAQASPAAGADASKAPDDGAVLELEDTTDPEVATEDALPEGDPEQLLAEASVYLRYGKSDQAIASLKAVLAKEPDSRPALEKLGDAYSETGENMEAVQAWSQAAELAKADGEGDAFEILVDRIRTIDAPAADALAASAPEADAGEAEPEDEFDIDVDVAGTDPVGSEIVDVEDEFEIEFDTGDESEDDAAEEDDPNASTDVDLDVDIDVETDDSSELEETLAAAESVVDVEDASDDDAGVEIEIDDGGDLESALADAVRSMEDDEEAELSDTGDLDLSDDEASDDTDTLRESADAKEDEEAASASDGGLPEDVRVEADLEEADFYFQQSLFDEAEEIYRRVLATDPKNAAALLRLGEIAAGQGPAAALRESDPVDSEIVDPTAELDVEIDEPEVASEAEARSSEDTVPEAAMDLAVDDADECVDAAETREADEDGREEDDDTSAPEPVAEDEATFDLAAELADSFEDANSPEHSASSSRPSTAGDGFEAIFADFKKGVSQTLSEGDYQTRYDLGLAYREMELYDDAIEEFRMCLDGEELRFSSLHMMGICALALERHGDAISHLEQALAMPDQEVNAIVGVRFDLGRAFEESGDIDRARGAYEAVRQIEADFPGLGKRLEAVGEADGEAPALADSGGLESFDDVMADEEPAEEAFESFDDVITDVEAVDDASDDAEIADAEIEDNDDSSEKSSSGRKKKISFV